MESESNDHRYNRQALFRPIGSAGQARLAEARVAVVGVGALGSVIAAQLVRAGVGFVRLIDRDVVDQTNLHRQMLFHERDAESGMPKAVAAKEELQRANSGVTLDAVVADVTWRNAESVLSDVDVILDGSDNFQVRYLMNDVSVKYGIPLAYGGAVSSYGTVAFLRPGATPCLVCLFGNEHGGGHDTCDTVGVISPVIHVIASMQVAETLKFLTGNVGALSPGLTYVDVWQNEFRTVDFPPRNEQCPCCSKRMFQALEATQEALAVSLCGRQTIQVRPSAPLNVPLEALASRLRLAGEVLHNAHLLRIAVGSRQITLFPDGRALIHGTDDPLEARSLYAKYIGM